jgi:hypothetical protein
MPVAVIRSASAFACEKRSVLSILQILETTNCRTMLEASQEKTREIGEGHGCEWGAGSCFECGGDCPKLCAPLTVMQCPLTAI